MKRADKDKTLKICKIKSSKEKVRLYLKCKHILTNNHFYDIICINAFPLETQE